MSNPGRWMTDTKDLQREIHELAKSKGFWGNDWEGQPPNFGEKIALCHEELSEALQDDRKGNFEHIGEELADVIIRVMDLAEFRGIDLGKEILTKHNKNKARPFLHGKRY